MILAILDFFTPMFADFGITASIITSIVIAAASTAAAAAMAPGMPKTPDLGSASRAGVEAEAATLADRRRLEAAARQGTSTTYTERAHTGTIPMVLVSKRDGKAWEKGWVRYDPKDWEPGGKYSGPEFIKGEIKDRKAPVPESQRTADFTGFGDADVQAKIAQGMAEVQLEMSQKYGVEFAQEAARQLELADPEGAQARKMELELIQEQMDRKPDRPVADTLQSQVEAELTAGNRLDPMLNNVLDEAVAQSAGSRGGGAVGDYRDFAEPLETGFAGSARNQAAQQKALGWLTSGASPDDFNYRREQQNLANLGAFTAGETPVTQFRNLSGAQQGAAPFVTGAPLPTMNANAGTAGQNFAVNAWGQNLNAQATQANPWLAGLSMALSGASAVAKAGKV